MKKYTNQDIMLRYKRYLINLAKNQDSQDLVKTIIAHKEQSQRHAIIRVARKRALRARGHKIVII